MSRIEPDSDHAANASRQISGIVAPDPPSLPNLNCPFLIFSASSISLITMGDRVRVQRYLGRFPSHFTQKRLGCIDIPVSAQKEKSTVLPALSTAR